MMRFPMTELSKRHFTGTLDEDRENHEESLCETLCFLRATLRNCLKGALCLFLTILLFYQNATGQDDSNIDLEISGYVKELGQLSVDNAFSGFRYDNILHHRFETDWTFSDHFEIRADLRTRLLNGYSVNNTPELGRFYENDPNYLDMAWVWLDTDRSLLHSNIDRLHASYYNGPFEAHIGRQRINWGRTYVWNPNDLFNAYAFLDFDYEERPGVDAISAQYNWSYASSVEAGIRIADSFDEMVIAGMVRSSWGSYDIQVTGGHYLDYATLGIGWAGYIDEAGFKGEISYFHPEERFFEETGHFTATAGIDYMLSNGLYLQGELLYNGGFSRRADPLAGLIQPPTADNLFIAKSGMFLNGSFELHPLVGASLSYLGSFDRPVFILIPQITVSVSENVDFLLISQLLKGSVFSDTIETPNLLFFRLKWSY